MKSIATMLLLVAGLHADDPVKSSPGPQTHIIVRRSQVDVIVVVPDHDLAQPLSAQPANVTIKYLPSGKVVPQASITPSDMHLITGRPREFQIILSHDPDALPDQGDRKYDIQVTSVQYTGGGAPVTISATGTVYDASNIQTLVDATAKALSTAKTTDEKDLFAGLNIAVPSGGTSAVQGDFVFNKSVSSLPGKLRRGIADAGSFGVNVKKGSEDGKDPRHFNLGFSLRKTFLFASGTDITTLRSAISPGSIPVPNTAALQALNSVTSKFWRALLADYGFQMEGDVSQKGIGNVSNAVFDLKPQLATAATPLFGDQGFFALRFMPAGFEFGKNLTNPDNKTQETGNLSRYKAAAEVRAFYQNKTKTQFLDRIELTASSIYRQLFLAEAAYDANIKKNVNTTKGGKLWTQVDFKVFSGLYIGKIRPGLKVTYQRGYLPPVYERAKVFTYGLVLESNDGGN